MKLLLNGFFLFVSLVLFGTNNPGVFLSRVTPQGGVVYSQITSIVEDDQGFVWFSSQNGLFSYNATEIKAYNYNERDSTSISSNSINSLYKDNVGRIWLATGSGLCYYNPKNDKFHRLKVHSQNSNSVEGNISSLFQDDEGDYWFLDEKGLATFNAIDELAYYRMISVESNKITYSTISKDKIIWVFYENGDIYYLQKGSKEFKFFSKGFKDSVNSAFLDGNNFWIGYQSSGVLCLNSKSGKIINSFNVNSKKKKQLPGNRVRDLIKDENNQIWVATSNGIAILKNGEVEFIVEEQNHPQLPHFSVYSLFKDSNNNIWIGTWLGGLAFHSKYNNPFYHYTASASSKSITSNIVSSFAQVPNSPKILVGTDDSDINIYNPISNTFSKFIVVSHGDTIRGIKSLTYDKNGTLWVGTYKNGVLYKERNKKEFKRLKPPFVQGIQVLDMLATNDGIWIANYRFGVYFYDFKSEKFTQYQANPLDVNSLSHNIVTQIIEDKNKNIWFASKNGLNLLRKNTNHFIRFFHQKKNPDTSISSNYISCIHEDHKGFLWLGTYGGGLNKFNPTTGVSQHYTKKNGLLGNEIYSILQDKDKNLWVTTENGLNKLNIESNLSQFYSNKNGIGNNRFYPIAALSSDIGELYFGGSNGLLRFNPSEIIDCPISPTPVIAKLFINNSEVFPGGNDGILKDIVGKSESLRLNYNQNTIGFKFTSNNYINVDENKFKYRLKGFNDVWIETDSRGVASYTNLPSGNFLFEVKASNNNNVWSEKPTRIRVIITPPIWLSWYAYIFYTICLIGIVYFFRIQVSKKEKLKLAIKMSKIQEESSEKLLQSKLEFFTNISHEFRTPLTLIQGPVNKLVKAEIEDDQTRKQIFLIKNNTDRLLRLINQLLDFRRVEHGKLNLSPIHADIVSFCKNVFNCFEELATQKKFNYNFSSEFPVLKMDYDSDKLDKVLVNILSNAFKYSKDNGYISFNIQKNKKTEINKAWESFSIGSNLEKEFVEISIIDSGFGISSDNLPKIFDRFFQIEKGDKKISGTGIGLALSANYINMHNGQLIVSSSKGKGSAFYIYLPLHQPNAFNKDGTNNNRLSSYSVDFDSEILSNSNFLSKNQILKDNDESLILIVEDNLELLDFLEESLGKHFKTIKAQSGKEGFDLTLSLYPDLIVSDIMMPDINGIQLCEKIKGDVRTSHTPIILLSALSTIRDKISGINSGADAYISKPFNEDYLIVQINSLLNSRKTLRNLYASKHEEWSESLDGLSLDKKLIQRATEIIENNIKNNDKLTVEDLGKKLNISRTNLHRKLKSLTNQSATEFINDVRFKYAIELMKSGKYRINEIGFEVGFNSHSYFTKAFKKRYGLSPKKFMQKFN